MTVRPIAPAVGALEVAPTQLAPDSPAEPTGLGLYLFWTLAGWSLWRCRVEVRFCR